MDQQKQQATKKPRKPRPDTLTFVHIYEPNRERCIDALMILFEKKAGEERLCRTSATPNQIHPAGGGLGNDGPSPTTEVGR